MRRCGQCDQSLLQWDFVDAFFGLPTGGAVCQQEVVNFLFFVYTFVDKGEDTTLTLLVVLSDNDLE